MRIRIKIVHVRLVRLITDHALDACTMMWLARAVVPRVPVHRVLVLDDYPDAALSISMLLEALGHECRIAIRGRDALDLAVAFEPDIAFVDLDLPDIHGFEVARRLRALASGRPLFLAAITGADRSTDRVQALAAGFDHHVLKPIDAAIMKRVLDRAGSHLARLGASLGA
ncbi:MAG: hypothetical protein H6Q90_3318 [Deltaproteobacteria bacterium]|nr:hypothetical protein [Deltaproteobacteria bacterium]